VRIIIMMTEENIVGRELLKQWSERGRELVGCELVCIIVEQSERAEREKEYLKNDFYNPPQFNAIVQKIHTPTKTVKSLNGNKSRRIVKGYEPGIILLDGSAVIKDRIFNIPTIGAINAHPGILPDFRGVDSVRWAILKDKAVGGTAHITDSGLDTGPILLKRAVDVERCEDILTLRVRVMRVCASLLIDSVIGLKNGTIEPKPQNLDEGSYYTWMDEANRAKVDEILQRK